MSNTILRSIKAAGTAAIVALALSAAGAAPAGAKSPFSGPSGNFSFGGQHFGGPASNRGFKPHFGNKPHFGLQQHSYKTQEGPKPCPPKPPHHKKVHKKPPRHVIPPFGGYLLMQPVANTDSPSYCHVHVEEDPSVFFHTKERCHSHDYGVLPATLYTR